MSSLVSEDNETQPETLPLEMDQDEEEDIVLSPLDSAFKDLFVNIYKDKYIKGKREERERQERASVKTQQLLSISGKGKDPKYVNKIMNDKNFPLFYGSIRDKIEKEVNMKGNDGAVEKAAVKKVFLEFGTLYSWLSGILMDRKADGGLKKDVNNDEHAKSFPGMMVYGGGISQMADIIGKDKEKIKELFQNDKELVDYYYEQIKKHGKDIAQFQKLTPYHMKLIELIDYTFKDEMNSLTLNFMGLWLSEEIINKWKNNIHFDKLAFKKGDDGTIIPELRVRIGLIRIFVIDFIDSLIRKINNTGDVSLVETNKMLDSEPVTNEFYNREMAVAIKDHDFEKYENLKQYIKRYHNDDGKIAEWTRLQVENIIYIMQFLCDHYNKNLYKRTFLNCMMILLEENKPEKKSAQGKMSIKSINQDAESDDEGSHIIKTKRNPGMKMGDFQQQKNLEAVSLTPADDDKMRKEGSTYKKRRIRKGNNRNDYIEKFMKEYLIANPKILEKFRNIKTETNVNARIKDVFNEIYQPAKRPLVKGGKKTTRKKRRKKRKRTRRKKHKKKRSKKKRRKKRTRRRKSK